MTDPSSTSPQPEQPHLVRGIGVGSATALNMIDMIGVGPFITLPLIVSAIGGPQAMLGWIVGAFLAMCDGLVWAELGASLPYAGGSYRYLKETYGPQTWGRLFSFLFIWQLSFSAPLSVASGSVGLANYASYLWPALTREIAVVPLIGQARIVVSVGTLAALAVVLLAVVLLYRSIVAVGALSKFLSIGVLGTVAWVIFAGLTHFDSTRAFDFPPGAFHLSHDFFTGLGAALLIAAYDYWGYYNVCFLGDEVKDPERTIPRALVLSIAIVAVLYLAMNISVLGVIPWREMMNPAVAQNKYIVSVFMERIYGAWAGKLAAGLIIWTAFASVFSLLLGYSRVPYAAAIDGNYFAAVGRVHPKHRIPHVSLLVLGGVALLACFLDLRDIIAALVVIRIVVQFLLQTIGLLILRTRRPEMPRPFRMWLYPLPALISAIGFLYILIERKNFTRELRYAAVIVVIGLAVYLVRSWRRQEWPFRLQTGI
jgi:basic amino acid/polyamine antiporter, APA family